MATPGPPSSTFHTCPLRPNPFFLNSPSTCIEKLLLATAIDDLCWIWQNHLKQDSLPLWLIGAIPECHVQKITTIKKILDKDVKIPRQPKFLSEILVKK